MPEPQNPYAAPQYQDDDRAPLRLTGNLASLGQRFMGRLVDNLGSAAVSLVALFTIGDGVRLFQMKDTADQLTATLVFFAYALPFNALQWWLVVTSGQSIGKKLANTRIVRDDNSPVGFASGVVLREWVMVALGSIPVVGTLVALVDGILIFVGHEKKTLHDRIAGTKVIDASVLFQTDAELEALTNGGAEAAPKRRKRRRKKAAERADSEPTPSDADRGPAPSDQ
jgi:uncharacterized RDD family membrane protein YckC